MLACDKTHTHKYEWSSGDASSGGCSARQGALTVLQRDINNSPALVYFLLVLPHGFFPSARIAEDFSISICIPSPEFLISFSRCWGPTKQAESTQAWSCFAELECVLSHFGSLFKLFFPIFYSPVNMGVDIISVNKKGSEVRKFWWVGQRFVTKAVCAEMLKAVSTRVQTSPCFPPSLVSGEGDSFKI